MTLATLHAACALVGLPAGGAEAIKLGENDTYRLPQRRIVVRIGRAGQLAAATREVSVAQWLARSGVPAVEAMDGVEQPVSVADRPVTFWHELPPHTNGTPLQVAWALRRLHDLTPPQEIGLGQLDPSVRLRERIDAATYLTDEDRAWLQHHHTELAGRFATQLPAGLPECVVHGDAWTGNVVATDDGQVVLLDLERCAVGPPEWDLVSTAIKHSSFAWISRSEYQAFSDRYGSDVTTWAGFELLRDLRELRMTCYLAQAGTTDPRAAREARLRIRCLRGVHGPRPWPWTPAA